MSRQWRRRNPRCRRIARKSAGDEDEPGDPHAHEQRGAERPARLEQRLDERSARRERQRRCDGHAPDRTCCTRVASGRRRRRGSGCGRAVMAGIRLSGVKSAYTGDSTDSRCQESTWCSFMTREQSLEAAVYLVNTLPGYDDDDTLQTIADFDALPRGQPLHRRDPARRGRARRRARHPPAPARAVGRRPRGRRAARERDAARRPGAPPPGRSTTTTTGTSTRPRDDAPLATRILVEAAMAFVDVIRSDEYDRVRVCSADDCDVRLHRLLAERLQALLRHRQLRQPHERQRVPGSGRRKKPPDRVRRGRRRLVVDQVPDIRDLDELGIREERGEVTLRLDRRDVVASARPRAASAARCAARTRGRRATPMRGTRRAAHRGRRSARSTCRAGRG